MKNVLIVAAHPDDEVLGVGGTIAKHVSNKDKVSVVTFTDGVSSRSHEKRKKENSIIRFEELGKVSSVLGFTEVHYEFPDQELDTISLLALSRALEDAKLKLGISPDIVYTHYANGLNQDHRQLYYATLIAFRPKPGQPCKEIYCYQVPSYGNTDFSPTMYVSLTQAEVILKLKAWDCYQSEHNSRFNRESLIRMTQECGNSIGVEYAEAFEIVRIIR